MRGRKSQLSRLASAARVGVDDRSSFRFPSGTRATESHNLPNGNLFFFLYASEDHGYISSPSVSISTRASTSFLFDTAARPSDFQNLSFFKLEKNSILQRKKFWKCSTIFGNSKNWRFFFFKISSNFRKAFLLIQIQKFSQDEKSHTHTEMYPLRRKIKPKTKIRVNERMLMRIKKS